MFGAPTPAPPTLGSGHGPPPTTADLGSPPPTMFGAPPPEGAFGAPPRGTADVGSPPPSAFGAPPQDDFGAPPPQQSSSGVGESAPTAAELGPPPSSMFGGPPEGLFGAEPAPMNTRVGASSAATAENSPSLARTFGAPAQDAFAAPPPPSSAAGAAGLRSPPASMFDAPPRGAFEVPRPPPSSGKGGGSASGGGTLEAGAAGSRAANNGTFGATADGQTGPGPFGDFDAVAGGPGGNPTVRSFAQPAASGTGGDWPPNQHNASGIGTAPFGSQPGGGAGAFGGGGEEGDQSSNWWESETANDDQPNAEAGRSETLASTATALPAENAGESTGAAGVLEGMRKETPSTTTREPQNETPRPVFAETAGEDLGAPPADMFGPLAGAQVATPEVNARDQGVPPLGQPPRPQGTPKEPGSSRVADSSSCAAVVPFASKPRFDTKEDDVGDVERKESTEEAGVEAGGPSGSGVGGWADRTPSPGWEKQPSPPLELGVFGAPPDDSFAAAESTADLFGAAAAATAADYGKSAEGEGEYSGWGAPSVDSDGGVESERAKGMAGEVDAAAAAAAAPVPAAPTSRDLLPKIAIPSNPHPRSSFVANDGTSNASVAAMAMGSSPSSPPRLFASRSSSWADRDNASTGANSDYQGMFADMERKDSRSGLLSREGSAQQQQQQQQLEPADETEGGKIATGVSTRSSVSMGEVSSLLLPKAKLARGSASLNPPPTGRSASGEPPKYSQGAPPPFSAIPEVLDSQSPPRLRGRPSDNSEEQGSAAGLAPSSSSSSGSNARHGASDGPNAATPEGGGKALPGSTLSTPFGAWSRGSATTAGNAEGFPPLEDGRVCDDPPMERPLSIGKEDDATDAAESSELSEPSREAAASAVAPRVSAVGRSSTYTDAAAEQAGIGTEAGLASNLRVGEGKVDEQPRSDAVPTAATAAAAAAAVPQAAAQPSPLSAAGEAVRKVDADSAPDDEDGWSDDDWGVDDDDDDEDKASADANAQNVPGANADGKAQNVAGANADAKAQDVAGEKVGVKEEPAGGTAAVAAVEGGDEVVTAVEGGVGRQGGGEGGRNLFGTEDSDGGEGWGQRSGGGRDGETEGDGKDSRSGSESERSLGGFDDNEVSIAETTASDFFSVRGRAVFFVCRVLIHVRLVGCNTMRRRR